MAAVWIGPAVVGVALPGAALDAATVDGVVVRFEFTAGVVVASGIARAVEEGVQVLTTVVGIAVTGGVLPVVTGVPPPEPA